MDLKEIGCDDWIHVAQDTVQSLAFVETAMNLRVIQRRGIS
jgi:hypothetical protein